MHNADMRFADFSSLIALMPTAYHSTTVERSNWKDVLDRSDGAGYALRSVFSDFATTPEQVRISRSDLHRLAKEPQLERFVMAVMLWGYEKPSDLRGTNLADFLADPAYLSALCQLLISVRGQSIADWDAHFKNVVPIRGIGLSTHTKFLNFLLTKVHGYPALILDSRIIRVVQRDQAVFPELLRLKGLTESNKDRMYPLYLRCIHEISDGLRVPAENMEFFLYNFGGTLKDIQPNIRLLAYELYEKRGRGDGRALEDWLRAEAEVRGIS
jgi:hypothetical protein